MNVSNIKSSKISIFLMSLFFFVNLIPTGFFTISNANLSDFINIIVLIYFFPKLTQSRKKAFSIVAIAILYTIIFWLNFTFHRSENILFPILNIIRVAALFSIGCYASSTTDRIIKMYQLYILAGLCTIAFGYLIFFVGEPFASIRIMMIGKERDTLYYSRLDQFIGLEKTIFSYGYFLSSITILPVGLYLFYNRYNIIKITLISTPLLVAILLNGERISFASCSLFLFILIYYKYRRRSFKVILLITVFLSSTAFLFSKIEKKTHLFTRIEMISDESNYLRLYKQYAGIIATLKSPIWGGTVKNYQSIFRHEAGWNPSSIHNTYINVGFYVGIIGWLLLAMYFYKVFKNSQRFVKFISPNTNQHYIISLCFCLAVLIVGLFHNAGVFTLDFYSWVGISFFTASKLHIEHTVNVFKKNEL